MKGPFRLEGIYSLNSLQEFHHYGVRQWLFDLRPKSFNFIQQYVLNDCLKFLEQTGLDQDIYLRIQFEKDFMVDKIIKDLRDLGLMSNQLKFFFELSEVSDIAHAERNSIPYLFHYDFKKDSSAYSHSLLQGIILTHSDFERMQKSQQVGSFIQEMNGEISQGLFKDKVLGFSFDWHDDLQTSVIDFMPFTFYSLPINGKVESSYRQLDKEAFKGQFSIVQRRLLSNAPSSRIST